MFKDRLSILLYYKCFNELTYYQSSTILNLINSHPFKLFIIKILDILIKLLQDPRKELIYSFRNKPLKSNTCL